MPVALKGPQGQQRAMFPCVPVPDGTPARQAGRTEAADDGHRLGLEAQTEIGKTPEQLRAGVIIALLKDSRWTVTALTPPTQENHGAS